MPTASFRFGQGDVHELRMEFSWFGGERYYVDGNLKAEDLFPEINMKLQQRRKPWWVYVAAWLAIALISFTATVWLSK